MVIQLELENILQLYGLSDASIHKKIVINTWKFSICYGSIELK